MLGTVVAAFLMDRAGRKQLLTLSFTGMGLSMLAMSAGLGLPQFASSSGAIALVGTLLYVVCFSLGAGPVPGLLVPEITPTRLRGERCLPAQFSAALSKQHALGGNPAPLGQLTAAQDTD